MTIMLCTCVQEVKDRQCPIIGHPGETDRSTRALALEILEKMGEFQVGDDPIFFRDGATGMRFEINAVTVEGDEPNETVYLEGEWVQ